MYLDKKFEETRYFSDQSIDVIDHMTLKQNMCGPILYCETPCSKVYKTTGIISVRRKISFSQPEPRQVQLLLFNINFK